MSEANDRLRPRREDYERALESMDTYLDVGVDDLMNLAERAEHYAAQRRTEGLQLSNIMSQPVRTVHPQTSISEAAHILVSERISGLPVVDAQGIVLGIVTEADFLRGLGLPSMDPAHNIWQTLETMFEHLKHHGELQVPADPVSAHMTQDVVCASPHDDVHDAVAQMQRHRVKRLLVCDAERRLLGIVSRSDLVRLFFDRYRKAVR